jgi:hypothetical protein
MILNYQTLGQYRQYFHCMLLVFPPHTNKKENEMKGAEGDDRNFAFRKTKGKAMEI